jgi:serine/threonine-protein kinase
MIGATDVFVSYKAEDRARLRPLIAALETEGFTVWWDTHIGGGAHWREDIQEHLDAAKCVIVVWSRRSVGIEGDFVRDEASRARKRGAYLPVRLDAVEPPLGFGEVQAISLKGWRGDPADPRFCAIAEAIRRRIAGEDIAHVDLGNHGHAVSRRTLVVGGAAAATALAATGGWILLKSGAANAKRIAVLPFDNLSADASQTAARTGNTSAVEGIVSQIQRGSGDSAMFQYAQVYAQARQFDRAFEALERGLLVKDPGVTGVRTDPFLDPIRRDPRYSVLVKKINFPACT